MVCVEASLHLTREFYCSQGKRTRKSSMANSLRCPSPFQANQ